MEHPTDTGPRIAVVIITRDRAPELLRTLAHLHALAEHAEIVVVDNTSNDATPEQVRRLFPEVRVLELSRDHGAAGRNAGAQLVDAPYVAFCDDDSWWAPGALAGAAALLDAHPTVALVSGRVLLGDDERLDPACAAMADSALPRDARLPGPSILGFVGCGAIVRRSAFLAVGGFEPRFAVGGEEQLVATDLAAAGWDLVYRDDLVAHHHPSATRDREERQAITVRNVLWFTWLRRRLPAALTITARAARHAIREPASRTGLIRALRDGRWVVRRRRPVPRWLESRIRLLDGPGR